MQQLYDEVPYVLPYYNAARWPKIKNNSSILSECTILTVTGLKPAQDRPNWFLINCLTHLAILSHLFLLHEVSILGPLGYEPNTLTLRHGADARALSELTTPAW